MAWKWKLLSSCFVWSNDRSYSLTTKSCLVFILCYIFYRLSIPGKWPHRNQFVGNESILCFLQPCYHNMYGRPLHYSARFLSQYNYLVSLCYITGFILCFSQAWKHQYNMCQCQNNTDSTVLMDFHYNQVR